MCVKIGGLRLLLSVQQTEQARAGGTNKSWIVLHKRPFALLRKRMRCGNENPVNAVADPC
jgi:hypothetical protein